MATGTAGCLAEAIQVLPAGSPLVPAELQITADVVAVTWCLIHYDIAELVDPHDNVVARIGRKL